MTLMDTRPIRTTRTAIDHTAMPLTAIDHTHMTRTSTVQGNLITLDLVDFATTTRQVEIVENLGVEEQVA